MNKSIFIAAAFAALSKAQTLDKPALTSNLDYLLDGNVANLPSNGGPYWGKWEAGLIPADCKSLAEGEGLNPSDFEVWDIFFDDVCLPPYHFGSLSDGDTVPRWMEFLPAQGLG
jgi:hypothetical protein